MPGLFTPVELRGIANRTMTTQMLEMLKARVNACNDLQTLKQTDNDFFNVASGTGFGVVGATTLPPLGGAIGYGLAGPAGGVMGLCTGLTAAMPIVYSLGGPWFGYAILNLGDAIQRRIALLEGQQGAAFRAHQNPAPGGLRQRRAPHTNSS